LTSERARNIHRATEIRDQDDNLNAALNAGKWLHNPDGDRDQAAARAASQQITPGVVVTVNVNRAGEAPDETVIEVNPAGGLADD
jgi:hypothetical protein